MNHLIGGHIPYTTLLQSLSGIWAISPFKGHVVLKEEQPLPTLKGSVVDPWAGVGPASGA